MVTVRHLPVGTRLKLALGQTNVERLRIVRRAADDLRRTFATPQGKPVGIEDLRAAVDQLDLSDGSVLLVQSSMTNLIGGGDGASSGPGSALRYARQVLDLLLERVGERGTLLMPTQSISGYLGFSHRGEVFDYETMPSRWGLLSELFRRLPGTVRSIHPHYNISARGPLARDLIEGHGLSEPYTMDAHTPWYRLKDVGGKVLLLGLDFDVNSAIHVVEYVHPLEYPRPLYYDKPFPYRTRTWDGEVRTMQVALHAIPLPDWALPRFCGEYLQSKHSLYSIQELGRTKLIFYDADAQYRALYAEMQDGVCWYDAQYW